MSVAVDHVTTRPAVTAVHADTALYLGWDSVAYGNWSLVMASARAPSNYKDQVKIDEYVRNANAARAEEAKLLPGVAKIAQVVVLTNRSVTNFSAAAEFFRWCESTFPQWYESLNSEFPIEHAGVTPMFFGFDIKTFLRVASIDAIRGGLAVPARLWLRDDTVGVANFADPYEMVLTGPERKMLELPGLLQIFGVPTSAGHDAATDRALQAKLLVKALKLAK